MRMRVQAIVQVKKELDLKSNMSIEVIEILRKHFIEQDKKNASL